MATVASMEKKAQLRIRDLICEDPIALEKWARVVDEVVSSAVDVLKIKDGLKKHDYGEAILRTLQHCSSDLVGVLRRHELNSIADKVATVHSDGNYSLSHIWHDVGDLPHDFSGRGSELETTHRRLIEFHSCESVDVNIVCISGPAACGKSTLARKYAFKNFKHYGGNVVWIDAESTESMRASFTKLATTKLRLPANEDNQTLAQDVYYFFKDRECLFVFDGLQSMEDFKPFRPKIISPLYSTPCLLVTSREGGLAPEWENELRILHYRVAALKSIEEMSKPAAALAKLISYLDPGEITVRFLEEAFPRLDRDERSPLEKLLGANKTRPDFETCLRLLEKHKLVQVSESRVTIEPGVQEGMRSSLSEEEEASSLRTIKEAHQHLIKKRTKDLVDEGTAHRLQLLHFDLKSVSLADYFDGLWFDLWGHSVPSSKLKIFLQAYEIVKNRFGEEDGATIQVRYWIARTHYHMDNYPEAIEILESLLPASKATLGDDHGTTGEILKLLKSTYLISGDHNRANQYTNKWEAWYEMHEKKLGCLPPPPHLKMKKKDMVLSELKKYDGVDPEGKGFICLAVNGKIFDVTRGKRFYGPDGPYSALAGHDATRAFATFQIDLVKEDYDDLTDLTTAEIESAKDWEKSLIDKYDFVGRLLKPGEDAAKRV